MQNPMAQLYPEDQEKVDRYLRSPEHSVERKPFRPWALLAILGCFLAVFTGIALYIARFEGLL